MSYEAEKVSRFFAPDFISTFTSVCTKKVVVALDLMHAFDVIPDSREQAI